MTSLKILSALAAIAALSLPGTALAANVTVTVKNKSTSQTATYSINNTVQAVTNANANPSPAITVAANGTDVYTVSQITNLVTTAQVQYTLTGTAKQCVFHTAFTATPSGSAVIPNWTKSATSSGGATCTANITSLNASTYNWAVEFTIK